jgi:N-acetylmuramoyl-L-alanine amidase
VEVVAKLRFGRFSGSFARFCVLFWGVISTFRIVLSQKERKIGQNNLQKRQTLNFTTISVYKLIFWLLLLPLLPACAAGKKDYASPVGSVPISLSAPTIVIDAGHGGLDHGARAKNPYCEEKRVTLQTARLIKKYLTQLGYHVMLTRSSDEFVPLDRRVEIANKVNSDLFVSIHFNSSRSPIAQGIEVFFCESKGVPKRAASSRKLANTVLSRMIRRTQSVSRGVKKGNFYVIRETQMPAILVEGGFISNPQERTNLKNPEYIEEIARGIADGVDAYFKKPQRS